MAPFTVDGPASFGGASVADGVARLGGMAGIEEFGPEMAGKCPE
jgi:cytidylate kinase